MKYLLLFFCIDAFAYAPTIESILRNPQNAEIQLRGIVLTLQYEKELIGNTEEREQEDEKTIEQVTDVTTRSNGDKTGFFKVVYSLTEQLRINYITQLQLKGGTKNSNISDVKTIRAYDLKKIDINEKLKARLLYSVLNILVLNDPMNLLSTIKKLGGDIYLNSERVNSTKLNLLKRYESYLRKKEEQPDNQELESPLVAEDVERQELINQIMKEPLLKTANDIQLKRVNNKFYWHHQSTHLEFLISNETRRIETLKVRVSKDEFYEFIFKDYILFNGTHEMPKYIYLFTPEEKIKFTTSRHQHFNDNINSYRRRLKRYYEGLKANSSTAVKPDFFL